MEEFITESHCLFLSGILDKTEALERLIAEAQNTGKVRDFEGYRSAVFAREEIMTTGIGRGIGVPHGITEAVKSPFLIMGIFPDGIDYNSLDSESVYAVFLIGSPPSMEKNYLSILARLSRIFRVKNNLEELIRSGDCKRAKDFMKGKWFENG